MTARVTTADSVSHAIPSLTAETATVDRSLPVVSQTPTVAESSGYPARTHLHARLSASVGGSARTHARVGRRRWSA